MSNERSATAGQRNVRGVRSPNERSPCETAHVTDIGPWFETVRLWVDTFDEVAPRTLEGLYVIGSIALNDWQPSSSDIDIVAITAEPADDFAADALREAHLTFGQRCPGAVVDGPFLAWGDLTLSPQGVSRPWTLAGAFHHDAECFELNPVTWYTLTNYGVRVRGPQTADLEIPRDTEALVRFTLDNARDYWCTVYQEFSAAIGELGAADTLPSSVPVWCLLGVCRMLYTVSTGDVTSKSVAGGWAAERLGENYRAACELAVLLRAQPDQAVGIDELRDSCNAMAAALRDLGVLQS